MAETTDLDVTYRAGKGSALTYEEMDDNIKYLFERLVPTGSVHFFAANLVPYGYLKCDGSAVTTDYPTLRQLLLDNGSPYGTQGADPKLPDLRGEFIRGFDDGKGIDNGRVFGSWQADDFKSHTHTLTRTVTDEAGFVTDARFSRSNSSTYTATVTTNATGGDETRPRNIALMPCIKW